MAEPLSVAVRRGEIVESVHLVHAVAVQDGQIVASAGDAALMTSLRSAAKPIQALPLPRAYEYLSEANLAIASASHLGQPEHVEAVRALLAKTGGEEGELECGLQDDRPPEPVFHNCSGKHAGMLAVCRARDWPIDGYRNSDHPLQRELLAEVADATGVAVDDVATGVDGCGVVCFAVPLKRAAAAFAGLTERDGGARIADAMRAHPELVRGEGSTDTELMRRLPGWFAKGGAEGLLCAGSADGLGLALKVADGNSRALRPAFAAFASRLGVELGEFAALEVKNSLGETVGTLRAV